MGLRVTKSTAAAAAATTAIALEQLMQPAVCAAAGS
jgi:hypothetical protein